MTDHGRIASEFYLAMIRRELEAAGAKDSAIRDMPKVVRLRETLRTELDGGTTAVKLALTHRLTNHTLRVDGESGELLSWYLDFLAVDGDESMSEEDALAMATKVASPPEGARLESAAYETMGGCTCFRARWLHEHRGLRVEGDFIEVLVNGKARMPFSFTRRFHEPAIAPGPRP